MNDWCEILLKALEGGSGRKTKVKIENRVFFPLPVAFGDGKSVKEFTVSLEDGFECGNHQGFPKAARTRNEETRVCSRNQLVKIGGFVNIDTALSAYFRKAA